MDSALKWPAPGFRLASEKSPHYKQAPGFCLTNANSPPSHLSCGRAGALSLANERAGNLSLLNGRAGGLVLASRRAEGLALANRKASCFTPLTVAVVQPVGRPWCLHLPRKLRGTRLDGFRDLLCPLNPVLSWQVTTRSDSSAAALSGPLIWDGNVTHLAPRLTASCHRNVAVSETCMLGSRMAALQQCKHPIGRCSAANQEAPIGGPGGIPDLEMAIFDFMQNSENPDSFPTQQQLINAGRLDLVEAVRKEGGWLAIGWEKEPFVPVAGTDSPAAAPAYVEDEDESEVRSLGGGAGKGSSRDTWRQASGQGGATSSGGTRSLLAGILGFDPREGSQDAAPPVVPELKPESAGRQGEEETDDEPERETSVSKRRKRRQQAKLRREGGAGAESQSGDSDETQVKESQGESPGSGQPRETSPRRRRKPKGYWQKDENLQRELEEYAAATGRSDRMPSAQELREAKRGDLEMAVHRRGGWKMVAELFGLKGHAVQGSPKEGRQHRFLPRAPPTEAEAPDPEVVPTGPGPANGRAPTQHVGSLLNAGDSIDFSRQRQQLTETQLADGRAAGGLSREGGPPTETAPKKKRRRKKKKSPPPTATDTPSEDSTSGANGSLGLGLGLGLGFTPRPEQRGEQGQSGDTHRGGRPSGSVDGTNGAAQVAAPLSMVERIRALESSLVSTRAALQSSRESLISSEEDARQVREDTMKELVQVTDSLEFRENEIMRTRLELRQTRAEVLALEGRMAADFRDARRALNDRPDEEVMEPPRESVFQVRLARVVWPNPGCEVFLTGSFDNWTNQIRMEKSNAGVFVANLQLPPGRYEIKFIVDGNWRVDPHRQMVYSTGNENNLLTVM